ncbi:Cro/Cl family transcriptional regulator [Pseudoxanthomonas jiangsuensis]|uniref:short-chain fatty acyl-CoA regulator family protein n=1 Tax=Pseudoxanthomonas jiangsuensis TaxID=619688 RepID=UPI00139197AA|nr:short-chain fatty acyl-CoA regulator family protein [Pseudoxanthomonas jiangsuensis]KAF1697260.1 Cro/Cl family transcriptional regulator [Pseudoxanthomonas jiangsuensis]
MTKAYIGVRLRRLREEHGLTQTALAKALDISSSYLNQIENNQRPLTVPVLLRINAHFGIDVQMFSDNDEAALVSGLRDMLVDIGHAPSSMAEVRAIASNMPELGRALLQLHGDYCDARERADMLAERLSEPDIVRLARLPHAGDQVRDYFNRRHNHVAELDHAAERLHQQVELSHGDVHRFLREHLLKAHGMTVTTSTGPSTASRGEHRFEAERQSVVLAPHLTPGQQAFQMAVELARLEHGETMDRLIADAGFDGDEQHRLARIGLGNYFAGALLMPYGPFLAAAEASGYDIEWLAQRFGVGFESVCHRLSTLQRPGAHGLPFCFIRVDRAGNVSKRHSATEFQFSRVGGSCPLWIVYEAFNQPGRVLTQIAAMPDGRHHFWISRQVSSGPSFHGSQRKTFAVSLGCELRHAQRLVYSRGLDLRPGNDATPIGPGCRVCDRHVCIQRAFPALSSASRADVAESRLSASGT